MTHKLEIDGGPTHYFDSYGEAHEAASEAAQPFKITDMTQPLWEPVQGYIRGGARRGQRHTIRKPSFHIVDRAGRIIGAIQTSKAWGDSSVFQLGTEKPDYAIGTGHYELTNYGTGIPFYGVDQMTGPGPARLAAYLRYSQGPESPLPELAAHNEIAVIPANGESI